MAIQTTNPEGIESLTNSMDLDGDGLFSDFYADASKNFKADGAAFTNCRWHPAETFTPSKNATYGNVTFDGLGEGQSLTLGCGEYGSQERFYNVTCENFNGGQVVIADYAIVNGINMNESVLASLHVCGRAQVNDLNCENSQIINLSADRGAQIVRGNFDNCTIDSASELNGSIWRNCDFMHANLKDVNFNGAQLSECSFVSTDMSGVDFTGARLSNCSFVDVDISKINAKGAYFQNTIINGAMINSTAEFEALQQADIIRQTMAPAMQSIRAPEQPTLDLASLNVSGGQQFSAAAPVAPLENKDMSRPDPGLDIGRG